MLSSIYSSYEWLPWLFIQCPKNYMDDLKNQRKYIEWASIQLSIKDQSDWYKINTRDIQKLGGSTLLSRYSGSLYSLLSNVYSEYNWLPWLFNKYPKNIWKDKVIIKNFMDWAAKKLDVNNNDDWYHISYKVLLTYIYYLIDVKELYNLGGASLINTYNFSELLSIAYPNVDWNLDSLKHDMSPHSKKSQYLLKTYLKKMFPQEGKRIS